MSAVLTHEIQYVADVSRLTKAVKKAKEGFDDAGAPLDKLAATTEKIASTMERSAAASKQIQRLGKKLAAEGAAQDRSARRQALKDYGPQKVVSSKPRGAPEKASGIGTGITAGITAAATGALINGAVRAGDAFAGAVSDVIEGANAAANSTVFSPNSYQRLSAAAKKYDTDIKQVEAASSKLRAELSKATVNPELQRGLKALGVTAKQIKALKPEDQLALISDRLGDFQDEGTRAIVAEKVFGTGEAKALMPLLNQGSEAIKRAGDEAERLGMVLSDSAVEAAAQTKDALQSLGARVDGLKVRLIGALLPTILDSADALTETFDRLAGPIDNIAQAAADVLGPAIDSVIEIVSALGEVAGDAIGPLADYFGPVLAEVFGGIEDLTMQLIDIFYELAEVLGLTGEDSTAMADAGDAVAGALAWLFEQASMVLEILGELATIVFEVGSLIWDLFAAVEETTGVFSGLASFISDTFAGSLEFILGLLEDISEMFDAFGNGEWEKGFMKLGNALLDFILEPLRSLVREIIWVADAISEDLVPDSVRAFADNTREGAAAFEQEEAQGTKKSKREQREEDRTARKKEQAAARDEAAAERAASKLAAGEKKVSKERMSALNQEGRKLSGPGLLSLGARDEKGREISVWLGKQLDTGRIAAAANRLGVAPPHSPPSAARPSIALPHTAAAATRRDLATPGYALQPMSQMAASAMSSAAAPVTVHIGTIAVTADGATAPDQLRNYAEQIRDITRQEISRQVYEAQGIGNPGGLAG